MALNRNHGNVAIRSQYLPQLSPKQLRCYLAMTQAILVVVLIVLEWPQEGMFPRQTRVLQGDDQEIFSTHSLQQPKVKSLEIALSEPRQMAWLLSFPNSGTSYTSELVRHITGVDTATNYGFEHPNDLSGHSEPVFADQPMGPFWTDVRVPSDYRRLVEVEAASEDDHTRNSSSSSAAPVILTKTHCGIHCSFCSPLEYVETTFSFRQKCFHGDRIKTKGGAISGTTSIQNKTGQSATKPPRVRETVSYSNTKRLVKAVHMIRNPFDNVVARFHLERRKIIRGTNTTRKGLKQNLPHYDDSPQGFRRYCKDMHDHFWRDERTAFFLDMSILRLLKNVPCRGDFIRYVEWHNLAFATTQDLNLNVHILKYERYSSSFEQTVSELVQFLELPPKREDPVPFESGKEYEQDYFSPEERQAVASAMRMMASRQTWTHIASYFEGGAAMRKRSIS